MRLPRRYISLRKRLRIALDQLRKLMNCEALELHHRPALCNRQRDGNDYIPRSDDADYLVYLPADEHDIETRVRGQHGQHSDLALRRKRRRAERKRKRPRAKLRSRGFDKTRTRKFSGRVVPRER